ncbi:MAG: hypothetical protein NC307_05440 [Roseburia sp.]|nr:hypothetical protein [Roseburia sp.]
MNLRYVEGYNRQEVTLDTGERMGIAKRRCELSFRGHTGGISHLFWHIGTISWGEWRSDHLCHKFSDLHRNLYYDQLFSHSEICVLTLLSMFAAEVYVFGMDRIYVEQLKSGRYSAQIAVYKTMEEEEKKGERQFEKCRGAYGKPALCDRNLM